MFSLPNILLSLTALSNIGLTMFVSSKDDKKDTNHYFAIFSIFLSFWAIVLIGYSLIEIDTIALYLMKSSYVCALIIGVSFYYFALTYPNETKINTLHQILIGLPVIVYTFCVFLVPSFLTVSIQYHAWGKETILSAPEYVVFALLFSYFFVGGLLVLWYKFWKEVSREKKAQLFVIATSVTLAGIPGMYFNLLRPSPLFQDFEYIWTGPLFTFIIAASITLAIFKLKLFNPKLVAAQVFTAVLWLFTAAQLLISDSFSELIVDSVLLFATVIFGLFLIRSVRKEVESRREVEHLAQKLKKANKRLKELDRMKSEFVSIASHQLRSPLTAIRGYTSMLLEDSYGKIPKKARDAIERIGESSRFMASSVEDYLNVSRIQAGNMKYECSNVDLKTVCSEIVDLLRPEATRNGLLLTLKNDADESALVYVDEGKVRQIIQNLIDNAVKYTQEGAITVRVYDTSTPRRIAVDIIDTGIGMNKADQKAVFEKFERTKNANEVNVTGTGLGLFIAKKMTEDMEGELTVHSDGEGEGTTFTVAFPAT